jgi:hypothetical protein
MKSKHSKKGLSTTVIIAGVGVAAALYMYTHKAAAGVLASTATPAISAAQYATVQASIVSAQTSDNATSSQADLDTITQAYLRGNKAELTGYVTLFQGKGQTNTAALFADALSHALSGT